jgi:membrane peptidoglycan carboxypeptidase
LSPADVPPLLRSGIKLIEDRRFDEHPGVDVRGICARCGPTCAPAASCRAAAR